MADVQKYFVAFDEAIRFERDDEKATLAEKRKRVLNRLSEGIKRQHREGVKIPNYEHFNQGSYAMNLGVKPINGDFDIDVGLRFDLSKDDYPDPLVVKKWVHDAVNGHTKDVKIRRGCVTVQYQEGGEPAYHVDLVCYSSGQKNADKKDYIAKGKPGMKAAECRWEPSDPRELQDLITGKHKDQDAEQFRRVVRALKRWKDLRFSSHGRAAPKGIALTVAAFHWFVPSKKVQLPAGTVKYDDLDALRNLVSRMLNGFKPVWSEEAKSHLPRLRIQLPISPGSDLCDNMSDASMRSFKERLESLLGALTKAQQDPEARSACMALREHLGDDFPVPEQRGNAR